ncbi:hypothetical protein SBADM41S_05401 [Streptomyces badius]
MTSGPGFLALAPHRSGTASLLAGAARRRGMEVTVLPADGVPERYRGRADAHYYGGPRFAARVAGPLGVALLEPHDGWLDALPLAHTGRDIRRMPLSEARRRTGPLFVKPPTDKSFPAAVHPDGASLPPPPPGSGDPLVQISEVVTWEDEFRLFLLDGEIRTGSQYAVYGRLDAAPLTGHPQEAAVRAFARRLPRNAGTLCPEPSSWTSDGCACPAAPPRGRSSRPIWRGSARCTPPTPTTPWTWCSGRRAPSAACPNGIWSSGEPAPQWPLPGPDAEVGRERRAGAAAAGHGRVAAAPSAVRGRGARPGRRRCAPGGRSRRPTAPEAPHLLAGRLLAHTALHPATGDSWPAPSGSPPRSRGRGRGCGSARPAVRRPREHPPDQQRAAREGAPQASCRGRHA